MNHLSGLNYTEPWYVIYCHIILFNHYILNKLYRNNNFYFENKEDNNSNTLKEPKEQKQLIKIENNFYDIDTLKRITIVRLTQCGMPRNEIREIFNILWIYRFLSLPFIFIVSSQIIRLLWFWSPHLCTTALNIHCYPHCLIL